ncbi:MULTISPECIES: ATP-binding protein [Enterobacteriaceae]|uniref:Sigma-54 factor interaction domain-containing protein n=2 Tax=Enterobacteriaceae TaxID=543 RepID=A0A6L5EFS6_9ENTR|nr:MULTISPECIES: ATP-binding protein [Enterobacteriaceae]HDR2614468.1 ATP-binding protein [Enterobacter ludwigii]MDT7093019.1 ATP-binding protein [Citrobacter freundii]MPQ54354.1 hypothetical protein [Citrobacter telavivensis]QFS69078.1 hypothetical protein GBC03_02115 [Citrobacter telavivensis]QMT08999.1 ATP-binding protein [Enterobacter kobei]
MHMKLVNGKPIKHIAKLFIDRASECRGNILLTGASGTGKTLILAHYLADNPADWHDFNEVMPVPSMLTPETLFPAHSVAIIDVPYLDTACQEVLLNVLRTARRDGRRLILSCQTAPYWLMLPQFEMLFRLKRLRDGHGISIECHNMNLLSCRNAESLHD